MVPARIDRRDNVRSDIPIPVSVEMEELPRSRDNGFCYVWFHVKYWNAKDNELIGSDKKNIFSKE